MDAFLYLEYIYTHGNFQILYGVFLDVKFYIGEKLENY